MFVLDTNSVTYFFKGMGRVAEHLLATPRTEVALPAVVLYELETGLAKQSQLERRRQLEELAAAIEILPFGIPEAKAAGQLRADLERRGTPIGPIDTLIAATALAHGATLVTHNVDEFRRVQGLSVVDWFWELAEPSTKPFVDKYETRRISSRP